MRKKTVTLVELLMSIALLGVIVFGAISFDSFSRQVLRSTERRTQVLNEAGLILDYITKDAMSGTNPAGGGIGDVTMTPFQLSPLTNPLSYSQPLRLCSASTCGNEMLLIKQDNNLDGRRDVSNFQDRLVGYAMDATTGQIYRCPRAEFNAWCQSAAAGNRQVLSNNGISLSFDFDPTWGSSPGAQDVASPNKIAVRVELCHNRADLNTPHDHPSTNPHVVLSTNVYVPAASEN